MELTRDERDGIRNSLVRFRLQNQTYGVKVRLQSIPFVHPAGLFKTEGFPCVWLGKQLVLKIVDELLDEGEGGEKT